MSHPARLFTVLLTSFTFSFFVAGCGTDKGAERKQPTKWTEEQKRVAADAIKTLGQIEAAVQVGVNFQQHGQLVIAAKGAVNEAERHLPSGEFLTSLSECMAIYQDANKVWNIFVTERRGPNKKEGDGELIERYKLSVNETGYASPDQAKQIIWKAAENKLATARKLQP